ncbi:major facilitator superfamily domain-containing protein [Xylariaceae sp. FL0594]|nr:major facilitator superfamily domain-containing protein [Xylariaceae sp. FL0594]
MSFLVLAGGKAFGWLYREFGLTAMHSAGRNAYLIILARTCRMFAYGTTSVILAIFFSSLQFSDGQIGLFMTLTLAGDVLLGTTLSLVADRVGRRKVMLGGSLLMVASGAVFATSENFWVLLLGAVVGVISTTGGDFGPFRSIEESMLSQLTSPLTRSDVLAWHVSLPLLGSSLGSEAAGRILHRLHEEKGWSEVEAYHSIFWIYAAMGLVNMLLILPLTSACELQEQQQQQQAGVGSYAQVRQHASDGSNDGTSSTSTSTSTGTRRRREVVLNRGGVFFTWLFRSLSKVSRQTLRTMIKLWVLLAIDSLADGMVPYSLTNYYLDQTFHPAKSTLGDVTSASYFLGGLGATLAGPLARRFGFVNTMVFTHVPSSLAVLVFPLPRRSFWVAALLLLVRAALNSMDQAPRTALIAAVVRPAERTAVMGVTSTVRTVAAMLGPSVTGLLAAGDRFWVAFVAAGTCRLVYDFGLYGLFINVRLNRHEHEHDHEEGHEEQETGGLLLGTGRDEEMEMESLSDLDDQPRNGSLQVGRTRTGEASTGGLKPPSSGLGHDAGHGYRARSRSRSRSPYPVVDE